MNRLITGSCLAVSVFALVRWAPSPVIWLAVAAVAALAVEELRRLLDRLDRRPWPAVAQLGTLAVVASFVLPTPPVAAVLIGVVAVVFLRALFPEQTPSAGLDRVVGTLLPPLYVGLALGHVVGLFSVGRGAAERERAEDLLILALCAVYIGDTCALYAGRAFGRHKLAPGISPAKTWEGAFCGVAGAVLSGALAHFWFYRTLSLDHALILGFTLGCAGVLGDLAESLVKRAATVKDSGRLWPGHGGMLDRVDSLLLAAPIVYWYQRLFLVLGGPAP